MEIKLEVDKFSVEYAGCGSHNLLITVDMEPERVSGLITALELRFQQDRMDEVERTHPS